MADYATLLPAAGFVVRRRSPGRAWLGDLRLETRRGTRVGTLVAPIWPIYAAGIDQDDELQQVDGLRVTGDADLHAVLQRHKPGDSVAIVFADRTGVPKTATVTLAEDPHLDVVAIDSSGLTTAQKAFRDQWLGPKPN